MHCVKLLRLTCSVDAYDAPTFIRLYRPINILQERLCSTRNGNIVESKSGTFCISYDCSVSFEMIKEWVRVDEYIPNFSCIPTAHIMVVILYEKIELTSLLSPLAVLRQQMRTTYCLILVLCCPSIKRFLQLEERRTMRLEPRLQRVELLV